MNSERDYVNGNRPLIVTKEELAEMEKTAKTPVAQKMLYTQQQNAKIMQELYEMQSKVFQSLK